MFHFKNDLLHLDDTCLFWVRPHEEERGGGEDISHRTLRAWGRLAAEALDSQVGIDNTRAFSRSAGFGSLGHAISELVHRSLRVQLLDYGVEENTTDRLPGVKRDDTGKVRVVVAEGWNVHRLAAVTNKSDTEAWRTVHHEEKPTPCFVLAVDGGECPETLLPPSCIEWHWIFRERRSALRIGYTRRTVRMDRASEFVVHLFRCGIRYTTEHHRVPDEHFVGGLTFYVDVITAAPFVPKQDLEWLPSFPAVIDTEGAHSFGHILLSTDDVGELSSSAVLRQLFLRAHTWRSLLWEEWIGRGDRVQGLVDVLKDSNVADDALRLLNGVVLAQQVGQDDRIDLLGTVLLRRLHAVSSSCCADYKEGIVSNFSIDGFGVMPVSCARYAHLFTLGIMEQLQNVSQYGFIFEDGERRRTLVVPNDCDATHMGLALSSLCLYDVPVTQTDLTAPPHIVHILSKELMTEGGSAGHVANEKMQPYFVHLDTNERRVVLTSDPHARMQPANGVLALDDVRSLTLECDLTRARRVDMMDMFPSLCRRIEVQGSTLEACLREAQARRVSDEWCLESLDCGGNLTSMGTTVLMALLMTGWMGVRVRVFLGRCRSGLLGIWQDSGQHRFRLVDCTQTTKNAFDIAPHIVGCAESGEDVRICKGLFIEVRALSKWHLACVLKVRPDLMSAQIRYLGNLREAWILLTTSCWRRLSRGDSDVDRVIGSLVRQDDKRARETDCVMVEVPAKKKVQTAESVQKRPA